MREETPHILLAEDADIDAEAIGSSRHPLLFTPPISSLEAGLLFDAKTPRSGM